MDHLKRLKSHFCRCFILYGNNLLTQNFDDILSQKRQKEIETVVEKIKKFGPAKIAVERSYYSNVELNMEYNAYLKSNYVPSGEETDQIAFRLGKDLGLDKLHVVSYSGNFDSDSIGNFALANNQVQHFDQTLSMGKKFLGELDTILKNGSIVDGLIYMNLERAENLSHLTFYPLMKNSSESHREG